MPFTLPIFAQMHHMLHVLSMVAESTMAYELYEEQTSHLHVEVTVIQLLTISGPILVENTNGLHYHWRYKQHMKETSGVQLITTCERHQVW